MKRSMFKHAAALVATLTCTAVIGMGTGTALADDVVQVSMMAPFSGQVAFYGEGYRRGFDAALAEVGKTINGHRVETSNADDGCTPEGAVNQVRRLSSDIDVVVGPACTGAMLASQGLLEKAGIPHIFTGYGASVTEKDDKLVFRASVSDKIQSERLVKWAMEELGTKNWVVVHDTSGYGASGAETFEKAAKAAGANVIAKIGYNPGEREFTGIALNADGHHPDAVYIIGYEVEMGLFVKQAGQAGIKARLIGSAPAANPEMAEAAGDYANGLYFATLFLPDNPNPSVQALVQAVKSQSGNVPKDVDAIGYTAGKMLIDALRHVQGDVTREKLALALATVKLDSSPTGPVALDKNGDRSGEGLVTIGVIKDGKPTFHAQK